MSRHYHSTTSRSCHHQSTNTINQFTNVSYTPESHRTEGSEHSSFFGRNLTNRNGNAYGYCPNGDRTCTFGHEMIGDCTFGYCPIGNSVLGNNHNRCCTFIDDLNQDSGFGNNPYRDNTFINDLNQDNVFGNNPYRDTTFGNSPFRDNAFGNNPYRDNYDNFGNNPMIGRDPGNSPIGGRPTHIRGRFSPCGVRRRISPTSTNNTPLETAISNSLNIHRSSVDTSPQNPVNGLGNTRAGLRRCRPNGSKSIPSLPTINRDPGNNPIEARSTHIEGRPSPIGLPRIVSPISTNPASLEITFASNLRKKHRRGHNAALQRRQFDPDKISDRSNTPNGSRSIPNEHSLNPTLSNDKSKGKGNAKKAKQSAQQSLIDSAKQRNQNRSPGKARECAICMEDGRQPDCYLRDCGHLVTCMDCAEKLQQCPVCRKPIKERLRVYT